MKSFSYLAITAFVIILVSCGGGSNSDSNSATLSIEENAMGAFSQYGTFSGDVTITPQDGSDSSYVCLVPLKITRGVAWKYSLDFQVSIADENHTTIIDFGYHRFDVQGEYDSGQSFLLPGNQNQKFEFDLTADVWEKVKSKGKYFIIQCKTDSEDISAYKGSSSSDDSFNSDDNYSSCDDDYGSSDDSSGSDDWDSILDSYESYVDDCISLMEKAAAGDMSALTEYPSLMEDAQELQDKLSNAQSDLSSSQVARYTEITQKLTEAAQNMR